MKELKFLSNRLPFYLIFYPTSRCNARCPHCYNYDRQIAHGKNEELTLDEIDMLSRNFGHIKVLTVSGGEPFLRDDLVEIVSIFYRNNGLQYVSFHTNAFLTDRVSDVISRILDKFVDLQVFVCISIDGIGEAHDRFRSVEGGFNELLLTIDRLKELKAVHKRLNLISSTIFSRSTVNSFSETMRFIRDNIGGIKPSLSFIRGIIKDETEKGVDIAKYQEFYENFEPNIDTGIRLFSPVAVKEAIETVVNKIIVGNYTSHRQTVACQAGRKLLVIYENGDIYPCEMLNDEFGNLRDVGYDVKRLLFSRRGEEIIKQIRRDRICYCTWENIIPVNLLFSPAHYPSILYEWFRLFAQKLL